MRSACTLAPSAFLASAAATLSLQNAILPEELREIEDPVFAFALPTWKSPSSNVDPFDGIRHIHRAWITPVANSIYLDVQARCVTQADKARLRAVAGTTRRRPVERTTINSDWSTLSNEAVRVAVASGSAAQHASLTYPSVAQQSTPEGCTDCPVGKVDQYI